MDRRFNERVPSDLPVWLTQLDDGFASAGQLQDVSDSGICSLLNAPVEPGAMVKLEILGLTLYGQVAYCTPEDELFRTGIFVEPALLDSSNITELVKNYFISAAGRM
jgi:PilZ domain